MRQLVYYTTAVRNRQALFTKKFIFFYNIIFKILFLQSLTFALRHDSVNTYNKFIILYPFPSLEVSMYQQQSPALKETNPHGSQAFPCAFYRLKLSGHGILVKHHWHEEVEIIYFPGGTFTLDINMETFDVSSECFYFILLIPANCTAYVHAQKKSPWNTLSFSNRNCSALLFTIRFRLSLSSHCKTDV